METAARGLIQALVTPQDIIPEPYRGHFLNTGHARLELFERARRVAGGSGDIPARWPTQRSSFLAVAARA